MLMCVYFLTPLSVSHTQTDAVAGRGGGSETARRSVREADGFDSPMYSWLAHTAELFFKASGLSALFVPGLPLPLSHTISKQL